MTTETAYDRYLEHLDRYDLSDEAIRCMIDRNHTPEEEWTVYAWGDLEALQYARDPFCVTCGEKWPCALTERVRAYREEASLPRNRATPLLDYLANNPDRSHL